MLETPDDLLEERRRKGLDVFDEVWEGVLHMALPPTSWHQRFGARLVRALAPVAERLNLEVTYETGVYRSAQDYRTPDVLVASPSDFTKLGVSTALVVFEIL